MSRQLQITVVGDSKKAEAMFRRLGSQASGFGLATDRAARVAKASFIAVGAAAVAGLGSAVKTTIDFDRSMRNVNSIAKLNEKQFGQLEKSVLGMAASVGQKPKVLADGLYDIESSGFAANDAVKVLRVSAKAATAGLTDTATASKAVAAALNAYHMGADQARQVSDVLFQTVNKGVLTFEELSQNMGDLVPAAAPLGVTLNEVGAGMATLTLQGVTAAEAATRMKNAMLALAKPTPALSKLLKENGYTSGTAAVKALGFAGVLDLLSKSTKGSVAAQAALTPNIRTLLGVVGLTGKNLKVYNDNLRAMQQAQKGAGITAQVFAEQSKSVGVQWQKVSAAIDVLKIQIGSALLPALKTGLDATAGFLQKLNAANGARAKIEVVFDTAKDAGVALQQRLTEVVAGIDWRAAGASIAAGLGSGIAQAKEWATALNGMFGQIDWGALGRKAGPGLATALVAAFVTITDPGFWAKNWDLALAVAITAFGGSVGKVVGRLGAKLAVPLERVALDAIDTLGNAIGHASFRLGDAFFAAFEKIPLARAFGALSRALTSGLGKLNGIARFVIKVAGIDAAINGIVDFAQTVKGWLDRIVAWFKALPGRIVGAVSHVSLAGVGETIMQSFFGGIESKWEAGKGIFHKITSLIPHLKGPESKDRMLLYANGQAIMAGLQRGLENGWGTNAKWLSTVAPKLQQAMNRLQSQLDASQRRAEDRSNQDALAAAEKQLADAKKNGKGVADAERAVQAALQQIRDTANQRELDKLTRQHDKILAKLQALKDRAAAKLQALQDKAGNAFDALAGKIQQAFGARNDAFVSPAQAMIDQITRSDQQAGLVQAVSDAQSAVADAMTNGGDILGAQAQLQRAQHDLLINGIGGLQDQANAQDKAHQQEVDAQQEQLDETLAALRKKFTESGVEYDKGMQSILAVIGKYDGDFNAIGGALGGSFVAGLVTKINAAVGASSDVAAASGKKSSAGVPDALSRYLGGRFLSADTGAQITRTGFALVHAGETVSPASAQGMPYGGISGDGLTINVYGDVTGEELVDKVVDGINQRVGTRGAVLKAGAVAS